MMASSQDEQRERTNAGRKIRFLLETNRMPVPELARKIDISRPFLQDVVDGKSDPTDALLRRLASYFDVDADFFGVSFATDLDFETTPGRAAHAAQRNASAPKPAAKAKKKAEPLDLKGLAVRYQALVELMIEKGVFSAAEYHERIESVTQRR